MPTLVPVVNAPLPLLSSLLDESSDGLCPEPVPVALGALLFALPPPARVARPLVLPAKARAGMLEDSAKTPVIGMGGCEPFRRTAVPPPGAGSAPGFTFTILRGGAVAYVVGPMVSGVSVAYLALHLHHVSYYTLTPIHRRGWTGNGHAADSSRREVSRAPART